MPEKISEPEKIDEAAIDVSNGVYNDGACIKIVFKGNVIQINKAQIKTIDTIRNDTVRIDIGEGALKNIYVRIADVVSPQQFKNVELLRDYIKDLMIQNGFSTEAKQDAEISELQQIRQALLDIKVVFQNSGGSGGGVKQPLREDESQPNVIYKGYAVPNASTKDAVWAILKISRIDSQIIYEWADGDENYDNVWDSRYEIKYFPSGFVPIAKPTE